MPLQTAIAKLRSHLDALVLGQDDAKDALLIGLIAREHVYLQGEPGSAKTLLTEITTKAAQLNKHFIQLHRDTRVNELIGDMIIRRNPKGNPENSSLVREEIRMDLRPGGLLTAEVAVLDDITRAPGEALNVLLRVLNERQYNNKAIPLMCAVATSNPTNDAYCNEPLDPANLDRFVLQIKTKGMLERRHWENVDQVMARYQGGAPTISPLGDKTAKAFREASAQCQRVQLPTKVLKAYHRILHGLKTRYGCNEHNSLLTDRTMLVKTPRMIRAMALLRGRRKATLADLDVLSLILTFRVPEEVYQDLENMLEQVCQELEEQQQDLEPEEGQPMEGAQGEEDDGDSPGENAQEESGAGEEEDMVSQMLETFEAGGRESEQQHAAQHQAKQKDGDGSSEQRIDPQDVENVDLLMDSIRGRLERNPTEMEEHPGGAPRTHRRMRTFDEFLDSDPVETSIWLERIHPTLPRAFHRKKKHLGGKVVIIRDVSQSMEGRYARWTSSVITKMVETIRKKRMRIGYVEFNHVSHKYNPEGRFFTKDYDRIIDRAANVKCSGVTNYQHPLQDALQELQKGHSGSKHILFLTDGEPTQGDWLVREERKTAVRLGVNIHTLFIGATECPEILDVLSEETDGSQFLAAPDEHGGLCLSERTRTTPQKKTMPHSAPPFNTNTR